MLQRSVCALDGIGLAVRCLGSINWASATQTCSVSPACEARLQSWQQHRGYAKAAAEAKPQAGKKSGKGDDSQKAAAAGGASGKPAEKPAPGLAEHDPDFEFIPNRFLTHYRDTLMREMALKMGAPASWNQVPRIREIVFTVDARADTRLMSDIVDKKDLLLHALALEHITGEPVTFIAPDGRKGSANARGVTSTVRGSGALALLDKMVNMVLPHQMSFEGVPPAVELERSGEVKGAVPVYVPGGPKLSRAALRLAGHTRKVKPVKAGDVEEEAMFALIFKIDNLLLFPDFIHNFNLFEPLRGAQVRIVVERAGNADMARHFLSGFGLPVQG